MKPAVEVTFPLAGYAVNLSPSADRTYGVENVSRMREADVTTVLWAGGQETETGKAADNLRYYPEIVIAGDGVLDGNANGTFQNANWFRNAWTVTNQVRQDSSYSPGREACHQVDPSAEDGLCVSAEFYYRKFVMLFTGIQVSGPKLTPSSIDKGFHAIPPKSSTNPYMASCFFDPGDFTSVKDAMEMWWDPQATDSPYAGSCWRMVAGGTRGVPGAWPREDGLFAERPGDACTNTVGSAYFYR